MGRKQKYDALMEFIARVQGATGLTTPHIERVINSGIDITKATPADVYKLATGMDLPGPAQAYVPPAKQNVSRAIEGPSLEERVAGDPKIQEAIQMAGPAIARMNPELAQRVAAGDTEAMLEVYRMVVKNEGAMPVRQMELPLGDEAPSTGMIPFGVGGPGVPAGLSGPGVSSPTHGDMILARILGLNGPQQGRLPAPSILGLPAPQQARLTGQEVLGLGGPPQARLTGPVSHGLPAPSQSRIELDRAPWIDAVDVASVPVPHSRGMGPLGAAAAAGVGGAAAGVAASRLMPRSAPLTDAAGPESAPLQEPELTLAEDTPVELNNDGLAELAAETSPYQMVYPDGPPDAPGDRLRAAKALALGGTPISVRETLDGMSAGSMDPLRASAINRAEAEAAAAQAAMDRYNANNNPWRGYGRVRPTR